MVSDSFYLRFTLDPTSAFAIWSGRPTYNSSTGVVVFPQYYVLLNIGDHYNTTTGKYTCHYPGIYVFSLNLYKKTGTSGVTCWIRKNGSTKAAATVPSESGFGLYESSASTVLHLAFNDTVYVGSCSNPGNIASYTTFIGFLLKAD